MTSLADLIRDPGALRVQKRPVPVRVAFAVVDGVCETLEGSVRYRAGDAIITGGQGERWPIVRQTFDAAYRPLAPTGEGRDGRYVKRIAGAVALRLDRHLEVPVGWQADTLSGKPGDWLLRYDDGDFGIVQDDVFRKTYEPDVGEDRWPPP